MTRYDSSDGPQRVRLLTGGNCWKILLLQQISACHKMRGADRRTLPDLARLTEYRLQQNIIQLVGRAKTKVETSHEFHLHVLCSKTWKDAEDSLKITASTQHHCANWALRSSWHLSTQTLTCCTKQCLASKSYWTELVWTQSHHNPQGPIAVCSHSRPETQTILLTIIFAEYK